MQTLLENHELRTMMQIAAEAADLVMEIYGTPFAVDYKGPSDPVTAADRRANDHICRRLREAFPGVPIVAEESPREDWDAYRTAERVFFVDPVDGTREFVAKTGDFVVMIGLLEEDRPKYGVLHAPVRQTVWAGIVGQGAQVIEAGVSRQLEPLVGRALDQSRVVSSRSHATSLNEMALERLAPREVVPIGSAGLKGAAVADGRADIYLAPGFAGCRWDSCAPEALVRAVGGVFTDARGQLLDYRSHRVENDAGAVAAAPGLHEEVIDALSELLT